MRGNAHVRFGGRAGETDQPKGRHRAPARPHYWAADVLEECGAELHLAHPLGMKGITSHRRVKNDVKDAVLNRPLKLVQTARHLGSVEQEQGLLQYQRRLHLSMMAAAVQVCRTPPRTFRDVSSPEPRGYAIRGAQEVPPPGIPQGPRGRCADPQHLGAWRLRRR